MIELKLSRVPGRELRRQIRAQEDRDEGPNVVFSYNNLVEELVRRRERDRDRWLIALAVVGAIAAAISAIRDMLFLIHVPN